MVFSRTAQKCIRTAANLTSTLLVHHIVLKLEMILDKEAKITHEQFASQIEARLGSGEGDDAKGPDMKVWSKGRGLNDVRAALWNLLVYLNSYFRLIGHRRSIVTLQSFSLGQQVLDMIYDQLQSHPRTQSHIKASFSSPLVCVTRVTVLISGGASSSIPRRSV